MASDGIGPDKFFLGINHQGPAYPPNAPLRDSEKRIFPAVGTFNIIDKSNDLILFHIVSQFYGNISIIYCTKPFDFTNDPTYVQSSRWAC